MPRTRKYDGFEHRGRTPSSDPRLQPVHPATGEPLKLHEVWLRNQKERSPGHIQPSGCPLVAEVFEHQLVISIGVETLRYALMQGEVFRDEFANWTAEITDPLAFAQRMAEMLNDPEVQNAALGDLFDKLAVDIAEEGHESVRINEDVIE